MKMNRALSGPGIVSILTLDRLNLTKKAVESVLEKSLDNYRIVLCDNGSTDGTLDYLSQLKIENPHIVDVLGNYRNSGVAAGRNKIFRHIISNYGNNFRWILNLDNDCIVHEGYDKSLTDCFEETGALAVCPRIIQPDGRIFHNAYNGFLINLNKMQLKLEYGDNVNMSYKDKKVSQRMETDVILGTSAKTHEFLDKVGFYDEGHKIGWEDFSIALRAQGLDRNSFTKWKKQDRHKGKDWVTLRELIGKEKLPRARIVYEPNCIITHDHPVTAENHDYEKIRWHSQTISDSTSHFEKVWGVKPLV